MLYLLSILACVIVVAVINAIFIASRLNYHTWEMFIWAFVVTFVVIAIDGLFATLVRWVCPKKWFLVNKGHFKAGKKEARFYEKIGIKKWKDKVLELGSLTSFRKNKISEPNNNEYVARYILEANYGVSVHLCGMIFGFACMFCCPLNLSLTIGLPVAIINVFYNFLSFAILRYNLPKLYTLYKFNARKLERQKALEKKENK